MSADAPATTTPTPKGWNPPSSSKPITGAHCGICATWRADPAAIEQTLPSPLKPLGTDEIIFFANETVAMKEAPTDVESLDPMDVRFREGLIFIPCLYEGREYRYTYVMYTDSDWNVHIANQIGLFTKRASIQFLLPYPTHPLYREVAPGVTLKATVSRSDERLMTATFKTREAVDPKEVDQFDLEVIGMRFVPDALNERPFAHDLLYNDIQDRVIEQAWVGDATITLGGSDREGVSIFEPKEMLSAYFIDGFYYQHKGGQVLHDYLADS